MKSTSSFALGVVFILLCAIIWSGTAIATQYLYSGTDFESPYFITYLANFSLSLHLILYRFRKIKNRPPFRHKVHEKSNDTVSTSNDGIIIADSRYIDTVERNDYSDDDLNNDCGKRLLDSTENLAALAEGSNTNVNNNYSHVDILKSVLWLAPLWFLCNITWNYALRMTSNSSCTIINNTAASFTLIFSSTLGLEKITLGKVMGLLLCFGGAVCVGFEDKSNYDADLEKTRFWGDIVALSSAALDGMYITCIRLKVPDDTDPQDGGLSMQLVFGYIGIINLFALLPLSMAFLVINFDDVDSITIGIIAFIFINTCFDNLIADFLWGRATLLTSPTIATLTMSLTIPIAMVSDTVLGKSYASEKKLSIIGAILVVFGFILVTFDIDLIKLCAPRYLYRSTALKDNMDDDTINKRSVTKDVNDYIGIPDNEE
jgi:solute carrier family 35 protein F5